MLNFFLFNIRNFIFINIIFFYNQSFFISEQFIKNNRNYLQIKKKYNSFHNIKLHHNKFLKNFKFIKIGDLITVLFNENIQSIDLNKFYKINKKKNNKKNLFFSNIFKYFGHNKFFKKYHKKKFIKKKKYLNKFCFNNIITVIVKHIYGNGLLKIYGKKKIFINNKIQFIEISGIINPKNVNKNNMIHSSQITNMNIKYIHNKIKHKKKYFFNTLYY
ncbi:MAG: hypothetical protein G8D27_00930 [Buchnera aphidicola (Periphyllus aceris)]|nr:hypothetical protein [Buchnera aphidicola (Periphyllus aceris)]